LRIVRDGTLFCLVAAKKFLWMEIVALALILVVVPLLIYYGHRGGLSWMYDLLSKQQWAIQKIAIIITSVLAAVIAVFWSILRFDQIREKLLAQAKAIADARSKEQARKVEPPRKNQQPRKRVEARKRALPGSTPETARKPG
jgi:uncharacterized membrane protein YcjF (UPF0283 family)